MSELPDGWISLSLGQAGRWMSGGTPSTSNPDYWGGDIPWIGSGSLTDFRLMDSDRRVTSAGVANGTRLVEPGTILMVVRGMSLKTDFRIGWATRPMAFGQDCKALVAGPGIDPTFLAYAILAKTPAVLGIVDEAGHGTGRLNTDQLFALTVSLPQPSEQKAIAEVLGSLDDKIAVNTATVDLLVQHQIAEYEISLLRGLESQPLDEVAEFHNRKRVPLSAIERDERPGPIPYYGATGVFGSVDQSLFNDNLVLVGEDGSVITPCGLPVIQYIWGPSWVNNHAHVLTGRSVSTELLRFALSRTNVASLVTGAVQPKISMGKLKGLVLELPTSDELLRLEQLVASEMALVRATSDQTKTLAAMRDALLPLLMAGKIRIKDAEQMVGDVV